MLDPDEDVDPSPSEVYVDVHDSAFVVVRGEIDYFSAAPLDRMLRHHNGAGPLSVDMSGVTFIDVAGLNVLLRLNRERRILVVDPSRAVQQLLSVSCVRPLLDVGWTS